jgi:uncharacterized SAM-binding protein YcdF (DUF218 family)
MPMNETWTYSWAMRNILAELLMPPGIWIMIGLSALIFFRKYKVLKTATIFFSFLMIWITSTEVFSQGLFQLSYPWMHWPQPFDLTSLESQEKITISLQIHHQAIVILGAGVQPGAIDTPQYRHQDVSSDTMARLRMGARLAKLSHLEVLVTGGRPDRGKSEDLPEGRLMAMVLESELQTPVSWIEEWSNTTQENAQYSANILKQNQITSIYLVTHVWHMPRAKRVFEKEGLEVITVPVGYHYKSPLNPLDFLPSGRGINATREVWHEVIGEMWYELRHYG